MRIARVKIGDSRFLARLEPDDGAVLLHRESDRPGGDALREALLTGVALDGDGEYVSEGAYKLLSPVTNPSKFLGVGLNYYDHAREGGNEAPETPTFFLKGRNSIIGPTDQIRYDPMVTTKVDFEVELAVVIGCQVSPSSPLPDNTILGFTTCNDVTARDAQFSDLQWTRSKSFDTFGPLGPWIVTADSIDPVGLDLWSEVSGKRMQSGNTSNMVFSPNEILSYAARSMTLEPGDVITTGTPAGVGFAQKPPRYLSDGDIVEVHVEGIGSCVNQVSTIKSRS